MDKGTKEWEELNSPELKSEVINQPAETAPVPEVASEAVPEVLEESNENIGLGKEDEFNAPLRDV